MACTYGSLSHFVLGYSFFHSVPVPKAVGAGGNRRLVHGELRSAEGATP